MMRIKHIFDKKRRKGHTSGSPNQHIDDSAPVMEAYRILRTNIEFSNLVNKIKRILITSSLMGEGKSTTAVNLARVFAMGGMKTLVVDLDLRRPVVHKILSLESSGGIIDCILGKTEIEKLPKKTKFENLFAVTCGDHPNNPAEILASERLTDIIDKISEEFDVVIIDSPPSAALADASIISRYVDATIVVVSAGNVDYPDLENAMDNLKKAGANILGVVINNVTKRSRGYKYYYYDY